MSDWLSGRKRALFAATQKALGKCMQCRHPWFDGQCTCGKWGAKEEKAAREYHEDERKAIEANQKAFEAARKAEVEAIDAGLLSSEELSKIWERK